MNEDDGWVPGEPGDPADGAEEKDADARQYNLDEQAPGVAALLAAFAELRTSVEKTYAVVDRQAGLVDRLHEENERLRRSEFDRMLDPLVRDLVALSDACLRNAQAWLAKSTTTPEDMCRVLTDVAGDVSLILERQGVETFTPEQGEPFDRKQQRAARTETTHDREKNATVAATLRPGYRSGARTIRFADVVVYSYVPAAEAEAGEAEAEPR